ncbi:DegT/DnrJ/EryC1/StrS aminotransferase [Dinoroseobacter shibae DFL 12 = DSM 16493]|jgi:dTDP-4-amino-4,6-dideoxygalactose transaminase|uniref:DegT/DnrJ/EryC1/StrS aminotransferase n=1 Tax=Dinoroseobacter shibae (strain DSM 16493 / NCIMB 14021 / DFL 12) TaxID=398580 RepID=A8LIS4_DINSH|nr:DegT/DnrJ/EryC1/StrS family aminotransferase [Dinoroseobacter shibae]ABV93038.1 DegT/DnrJ/EryC1/StrS aminotransferase [Dinoroseobacter shibae DFL 12 = DSM 16493]URF47970.1 DegT/DnrJ/EryC1/StrS family aminotransferase [Dinoroseobacter shibae]URF52279.1 DegT/DnrJ/EryC1/StrS family aminotransferase [Dinoroseobacter shibae]
MSDEIFQGNFTQQEPIPEAAIAAAVAVMRSGRLHRYNLAPGELGEVGLLEQEFAAQTGARYCLAVASGGYAMGTALRALGVGPGDKVLTNAFTLAPVPGAVAAVGAVPVFLETTEELVLDLDDLEAKAAAGDARTLLLSHMRGHICDVEALGAICTRHGLTLIEDCAHTMGAAWDGTPTGRFGAFGCFSTQTYKHINSGEGGLLISDDAELMARAVMLSGSYMLYARHGAAPDPEVFERVKYDTPNVSGRMDHLRAAVLRPQLADLPRQAARWNALYRVLETALAGAEGLALPHRPGKEQFVASSFQFRLPEAAPQAIAAFVARCAARGVELKWFGAAEPVGFTSRYDSWRYAPAQTLPRTDRVLATLLDLRLPLTFSEADCAQIARILADEARRLPGAMAAE